MIKKTLSLTLILSFACATNIFASDNKLSERKARVVQNIEKRLTLLNTLKTCVNEATQIEDMKACRKNHHDQMKALKPLKKGKK